MKSSIRVLTMKECGNPRSDDMIHRKDGGFLIKAFLEDDNKYYRCRLDVEVINDLKEPVSVPFIIDWSPYEDVELHSYIVLNRKEDDWEMIRGEGKDGKVSVIVDVPPGQSRLSMHPPYDYDRLIRLLNSLPNDLFSVKVIGKSKNGRDIFAVEAGAKNKRPLVVLTRIHPYETVGSYFADGMIKWLLGQSDEAKQILSEKRISFLPMPNPDGVVEGYARTTVGKLDLSYIAGFKEPEAVALEEYVRGINARANFDLHGFMYNYERLRSNDADRLEKLNKRFTSMPEIFNKEINVFNNEYPPNGKEKNLGGIILKELGGTFFNSSWSWYGRDAEHLRSMGVEILKAYASLF